MDHAKSDGSNEEQTGGQGFQRVGSAQERVVRSDSAVGSCEGRLEHGRHEEQRRSGEEGHDDRCQESTLESALQGGRVHRVAHGSGSRAGSVRPAEFLTVRFPQGVVGVGRVFMPMSRIRWISGEEVGCLVIFKQEAKDLVGAVHGDDFAFGGTDEDLNRVAKALAVKFVMKVSATLVPEGEDQRGEVLPREMLEMDELEN